MTDMPRKTIEGDFIQIKKIGNSLGLILSKDMLSRLRLKEGDKLHIVEQTERAVDVGVVRILDLGTLELGLCQRQVPLLQIADPQLQIHRCRLVALALTVVRYSVRALARRQRQRQRRGQ